MSAPAAERPPTRRAISAGGVTLQIRCSGRAAKIAGRRKALTRKADRRVRGAGSGDFPVTRPCSQRIPRRPDQGGFAAMCRTRVLPTPARRCRRRPQGPRAAGDEALQRAATATFKKLLGTIDARRSEAFTEKAFTDFMRPVRGDHAVMRKFAARASARA